MVRVYLAEVIYDPYETGYTVGIFTSEQLALDALREWHNHNPSYGEDVDVVSEWTLDGKEVLYVNGKETEL
jgi:hypothetical protein